MSAKTVIAFISGTAVGAVGTWLVSARYFNKKNQEDIEAVKHDFEARMDDYEDQIDKLTKTINDLVVARPEEEEKVLEAPKRKGKKKAEEKPVEDEFVDYTSYSKKSKKAAEPDITETKPVKTAKETPKNVINTEPYIIDSDDFDEDPNFEKVELRYFANDNVMLDEHGEIASLHGAVGARNINILINSSDHDIYVRNDGLATDYHIELEREVPIADYLEESADFDDLDEEEED